ncbi:MAG TPA: ATP-binding protein [bacterium]|nr:ATP-binding protein [bacterium]
MQRDYSPFTPGIPVPVEFFVGRQAEITHLRDKIVRASKGQLQIAFLSGERGIGKSSLASFVRHLAERENQVLGLHTFLGGVTTLTEMVRRVFDRLLKDSLDKAWHEKVKGFFGDHIREVGLFGVSLEFGAGPSDLERMVHDFAPALRNLSNRLQHKKKGLLIILDDINGLAASEDFANWLKSLVDEIATSSAPLPLCLLLVGMEERRQSLIDLQPSLARVFDLISIEPWSDEETREFYVSSFSKVGITVDDNALEDLVEYTGGLPVIAHEIGDAVFKQTAGGCVDRDSAISGIITAAKVVGRKHVEPQVFQFIQSTRYSSILLSVVKDIENVVFQRQKVLSSLGEDEKKVFDNFIAKMKKLGVIAGVPEKGKGYYRFCNRLHFLYFMLLGMTARQNHE